LHSKIVFCNCKTRIEFGELGRRHPRQVAREDFSAARTKELNERRAIRRKSTTPTTAPPNLTLITHLGSGPGTTSPAGGDTQGPSLVDYSLELEAEFPTDMVFKMQGNAAKKTRRIVIGRTLGGERPSKLYTNV
jgi:hypothetical protein